MQKRQFIDRVAAKTGMTKRDSERTMDAIFQTLAEVLEEGDRIQINKFGVFQTKRRAPRMARNPYTGETRPLPAATALAFKAAPALRERLNRAGKKGA